MADNSNGRKKTLIVSVLAFLFIGGGIFLFFIIQGANDLTGANKNDKFHYGGAARQAAASFFKFVGFDDVESISKEGVKERPRITELLESGGELPATAAADSDQDWGQAPAQRSAAPSSIPKMAGRGGSGVGGGGAGGTKSSGGVSRFGDGAGGGNTRVTGKSLASAGGAPSKGTLGALKNARAMLGEGLRSGSAMTAKGKWDSSFGVGGGSGRGGSDLAYGKGGLVKLDGIEKGEVDNLKTTENRSLTPPDVKAFKEDKDAEAKDPVLKKAKEAAEDAMKKNLASTAIGAIGDGLTGGGKGGDKGGDGLGGGDGPGPTDSGSCAAGDTSPVCSTAGQSAMPGDTGMDYKEIGVASNGDKIYEIDMKGSGPGITDGLKDQPVEYHDRATMQCGPSGCQVLNWQPPVEVPMGGK